MTESHRHNQRWHRSGFFTALVLLLTLPVLTCWHRDAQPPSDAGGAGSGSPPIWPLPEDETEARKALLVNLLLPYVQQHNRALLDKRLRLEALHRDISDGKPVSRRDQAWLEELSERYRLDVPDPLTPEWSRILLRRIDIVPADLALAQGALESAWGASRFATEGNNYFGQWCFVRGCGLVPQSRPEGARHEVARFSSPSESVRRYMHNLNSHPRYTELRLIREQARQNGGTFSGNDLAAGLEGYSELGEEYIVMVRGLIRHNRFDRFDDY
ncbi:MAG: glucosaminidase domain-containing protein [Alcanivoracaceae bacterium]